MGGPSIFKNKFLLFSIWACHGHTLQRLCLLVVQKDSFLVVLCSVVDDLLNVIAQPHTTSIGGVDLFEQVQQQYATSIGGVEKEIKV